VKITQRVEQALRIFSTPALESLDSVSVPRTGLQHARAPTAFHREGNCAEYTNAIRDVLGLQVDASMFWPSDDSTHGFDNQAGAAPWMCW